MQTAVAYVSTVRFVCTIKVLNIIKKGTTWGLKWIFKV